MKTMTLSRCAAAVALAILGSCSSQPSQEGGEGNRPAAAAAPAPQRSGASANAIQAKTTPGERSVYYDFDKSNLRPEARAVLETNAKYLRDHPEAKVRIEGNADERGSAEYNLALGQRRAEAVAKAMRLLGVSGQRIEAVSFGEQKPRKIGHDEASWAENRRSDIVY